MAKLGLYEMNPALVVAMDYYKKHEKDKKTTSRFIDVSTALQLINEIFETGIDEEDSKLVSVQLNYGTLDACLTVTLPAFWSLSGGALTAYDQLVRLSDEISHGGPALDEDMMPINDVIKFYIGDVFSL